MSRFSFCTDIIMIELVGNNSAGERESAMLTEQRFSATEIRPAHLYTYSHAYRDCKVIITLFAGVIVS